MDDFALKMLEKAEQRSKELGLPAPSPKISVSSTDSSATEATRAALTQRNVAESQLYTPRSTTKLKRQYLTDTKENTDSSVEINITAPSNVQVDVEVHECDVDEQGNVINGSESTSSSTSKAMIRDTSRHHLQRLGALYSDKDISSPITRTEEDFCEDENPSIAEIRKKKFTRLAALASTINNWEDDPSHPDYKHHRKTIGQGSEASKGAVKKTPAPQPPTTSTASPRKSAASPKKPVVSPRVTKPKTPEKNQTNEAVSNAKTKALQWDQKVMNQLESQGFKRRETSTTKLVYDYSDNSNRNSVKHTRAPEPPKPSGYIESREMPKDKPKPPAPAVPKGTVQGQTAKYEKRRSIFQGRDPTELSLKDRMAIFERNKGSAPVPKAPFAQNIPAKTKLVTAGPAKPVKFVPRTVPTTSQYRHDDDEEPEKPESPGKQKPSMVEVIAETKATGMGVLNTVANLMSGGPTISEAKISEQIRREREEEMSLLLNRYKSQGDVSVPEAPPLPPPGFLQSPNIDGMRQKRRSGDDLVDATSPEVKASVEEVKRIRVSGPKPGRLYPALSDIESADTDDAEYARATASSSSVNEAEYRFKSNRQKYYDEDDDSYMDSQEEEDENICNTSLGREVMQTVTTNLARPSILKNYLNTHNAPNDRSTASEASDVLNEMDDYLDEALEGEYDDDDEEEEVTPKKKGSISSNSFKYDKPTKKRVTYQTIDEESNDSSSIANSSNEVQSQVQSSHDDKFKSPVKSSLTVNPTDDMVTLVHTVSFYRKQQKSATDMSPGRSANRPESYKLSRRMELTSDDSSDGEEVDEDAASYDENKYQVQEKIKMLLDEVCKQQTAISQASQALNLCASTVEFSGSTEAVEAERHLLIATHRRQACLDEVQRLRVENCIRPEGASTDRGRLTVRDITVPLKQDYIKKLSADAISGHHLVCLVKYNEHVFATKTVPTLPGLLSVKFPDVLALNDVYADFKVTLEIYGMTAQRELLPHDVKYHIGGAKKGSSKTMTPKGKLLTPMKGKKKNCLVMPPVQSPAGPNAVRTPALIQYGFVIFSLKEIQRTTFSLNSVGGVSPLEGLVHMRVNCELQVQIDYSNFLTMYEDVSGFGAWHRRWCRLHGHIINCWLYPDDEKKKAPIITIDLSHCITKKATTAPREICARLNTLMLEFRRYAKESDYESLTQYRQGKYTIERRLLSADTKEDKEAWCNHLNKTLALLRAWGGKD